MRKMKNMNFKLKIVSFGTFISIILIQLIFFTTKTIQLIFLGLKNNFNSFDQNLIVQFKGLKEALIWILSSKFFHLVIIYLNYND